MTKTTHKGWEKHDHKACAAIYKLVCALKKVPVSWKQFAAFHRYFFCMLFLFEWDIKKLGVFLSGRVKKYNASGFGGWWVNHLLEDCEKSPIDIDRTKYEKMKEEEIAWSEKMRHRFTKSKDALDGVLEEIGVNI